jgi:hypothetical protein
MSIYIYNALLIIKAINAGGGQVEVRELWWGTKESDEYLATLRAKLDLAIASDLLYIAIRDSIQRELETALVQSIPVSGSLLVVFQERRKELEEAIMKSIQSYEGIVVEAKYLSPECYQDVLLKTDPSPDEPPAPDEDNVGLTSLFGGVDDDALIHCFAIQRMH